ncbi:hypothetical protein, partial [Pseudoalteromonas sp. BSi20652]|uniref:hypothetical protein n=1 Tax=Pseudoalteromonas sp. BSi20652 TaxID=388384 RepID=UPI001ED9718C
VIFHHRVHRVAARYTEKTQVIVSHCSLFSPLLLGGNLITCLLMQAIKHKNGAFKCQQAARLQVFYPSLRVFFNSRAVL